MEIMRIPLNYGSLAGIIYFAVFLFFYIIGQNPLTEMGFLFTFWIPILFIYLGIKKFREEVQGGFITYGKALGQGTLITLVFSSFHAILIYLFLVLVDSSLIDAVIAESIAQYEKGAEQIRGLLGEDAFDEMVDRLENTGVNEIAMGDFFGKFMGGFFISLIIAAILKRNRSPFDEELATDE
ncbi:MAG: DUF4199 domain-containing protein [Bacteroidetes bacterium]|nr:DUF4199 domain-containing protein [Bacteroidota bacterium]